MSQLWQGHISGRSAVMLSLRFKSKRHDTRPSRLSTPHPPGHLPAQRKPPTASLKCQDASSAPCVQTSTTNATKGACTSDEGGQRKLQPDAKQPSQQEPGEDEVQRCTSSEEGVQRVDKRRRKGRKMEQQQQCAQKHVALNSCNREPERKRRRDGGAERQEPEQSIHSDTKPSKHAAHSPSGAELGRLEQQDKNRLQPQSSLERQDQGKRLQLVQQFAARRASASGSATLVERLHGARFRSLNEFLYTRNGREALEQYQKDPKLFDIVGIARSSDVLHFRVVLRAEELLSRYSNRLLASLLLCPSGFLVIG